MTLTAQPIEMKTNTTKMSSAAVVRNCIRRISTNVHWRKSINKLFGNQINSPLVFGHRSLTLTDADFAKKKINLETEVIKNRGKNREKYENNKKKSLGVADVWRNITVEQLAEALNTDIENVQEAMLYVEDSQCLEPNASIDDLTFIREIATKCGYKVKYIAAPSSKSDESVSQEKDVLPRPPAPIEMLKPRPPVVTVMGHVDHGKTTLLDNLRGASVAEGEAGGITQHIGAFTVTLENGEKVTFLDTPGHAAFSSMRARGANCTDIIVLVVAAEDGVMQQTKEVIQLANDGNVPLIVAINKIDAPGANIEATKRSLLQMGIGLEGHGGDVQTVCISALHGTNLDQLAEAITTQAVLMDLKSDYTGLVEGIVVESKTDPRRGKLSTVIVTRGTLRKGSILVGGQAWAKVRALFDHNNEPIEFASPGMPVEILGWRELPLAGDQILQVENEKKAHLVMSYRNRQAKIEKAEGDLEAIKVKEDDHLVKYQALRTLGRRQRRKLPREKETGAEDPTPKLNVILKADVHGSVEAILDVLDTYDCSNQCRLSIVHYGVGDITEGDIELAKVFNSVIYAFSLKLPKNRPAGVVMREFNVIYRLIEDLKEEILKNLPEIDVEEEVGQANVLQIFEVNDKKKKLTVLGCRCVKGMLKKNFKFKLMRNAEVITDCSLSSMRHLKNEVDSIKKEVECGLQLTDQTIEPEVGDTIVCYTLKKQKQTIEWDPGF